MLWTAAFAALLALPLLTVSLPRLPAPISSVAAFRTAALASPVRDVSEPRPSGSGPAGAAISAVYALSWSTALALLWLAGAAVSLAQMALAWLAMARVRRKARPFPGLFAGEAAIFETRAGSMPMTFGLLHPAIFLPADAAEWPGERRGMVLLHELAHIRRGDGATQLLARLALSLYWWNPLAWIAWRQFVRERERAADDLVLGAGARPSDYATQLLEIARSIHSASPMGWAAVAMARRSQLEGRLLAILDSGVNRAAPPRAAAWIATAAAIILIAPLAALRGQDTEAVPADVDATIRAAAAQKNHEMLEGAARAAEAYRQYDLARRLLDSSLTIREQASGQQSVAYGLGLVKIGDLERDRRNIDEADAFYQKAVSVLGNRPEAAPALIDLGLSALRKKDLQQAFDYFQRAQAADPVKAGPALMWMALVREQQKNNDAAEQLLKQALGAEDPHSSDAATTMQIYAAFLQRQGREDEAKALTAQASSIRRELGRQATEFRRVAGGTPLRVGVGITPPTLEYKIEPEYSEEARAAKLQGTAIITATVGTDGTAQNMKVASGLGLGLDEKALEAISRWKFKPATRDGQPVPVVASIEVNFRLL